MNAPLALTAPVGVFDSGAGGLSVVAAIRAALPALPLFYYADTAYAPYGPRSDQEIIARTQVCCAALLAHEVAALVVACNTATANAIDELRAWAPVPVIGVEPGLKPAGAGTRNGVVGVLATRATLASRRYRDLLHRVGGQLPGVRFIEHAAVGWVELVESGDIASVRARTLVRQAVQPLLDAGADTLVLGCTHYPFLRRLIEVVAPGVHIVETGPAVARELQRRLETVGMAAATAAGAAAGKEAAATLQAAAGESAGAAMATCLPGHASAGAAPEGTGAAALVFESSGDSAAFSALAGQLLGALQARGPAPHAQWAKPPTV